MYLSAMKGHRTQKVGPLRASEMDERMSWERLTPILVPAVRGLTPEVGGSKEYLLL